MKNIIRKQIYSNQFDYAYDIKYSDIPKDTQESDIIEINIVDSYRSENESYDGFTELRIIREVEETDEEYQKRLEKEKQYDLDLKKKRYDTYLKLKEEFEPSK